MVTPTKPSFKVQPTVEITYDQVSNLVVCALEGGSNYWCRFIKKESGSDPANAKLSYCECPLQPDGWLLLEDMEEDGKAKRYTLDLPKIKKGLQRMAEKYPSHWANLVQENEDANTGDLFLQLCLFGDLVYS